MTSPHVGGKILLELLGLRAGRQPTGFQAIDHFVDFLLSKDGQEVAAKMGYIPARADVAIYDDDGDRARMFRAGHMVLKDGRPVLVTGSLYTVGAARTACRSIRGLTVP